MPSLTGSQQASWESLYIINADKIYMLEFSIDILLVWVDSSMLVLSMHHKANTFNRQPGPLLRPGFQHMPEYPKKYIFTAFQPVNDLALHCLWVVSICHLIRYANWTATLGETLCQNSVSSVATPYCSALLYSISVLEASKNLLPKNTPEIRFSPHFTLLPAHQEQQI